MADKTLVDLFEPVNKAFPEILSSFKGATNLQKGSVQAIETLPSYFIYDVRGFKEGEKEIQADLLVPAATIEELPKAAVDAVKNAFKDFGLGEICYIRHQGRFPPFKFNAFFGESKENCMQISAETSKKEYSELWLEKKFLLYGTPGSLEETIIELSPDGISLVTPGWIRGVNSRATNPHKFLIKPDGEIKPGQETPPESFKYTVGPFLSKKFDKGFLESLKGYKEGDYFSVLIHHIPGDVASAVLQYSKWVKEDQLNRLRSNVSKARAKDSEIILNDLLHTFETIKKTVRNAYADLGEYCAKEHT
ncbi:MAG: hypothetical protein NTY99_00540 [DPANN group archaeon]|nr:hypothetical protein [DPANN group archaeon]